MATPTEVQSVTVSLRSAVSEATLPNNVKMRASISYAISLEDWGKISQGARDTVVAAPTFNTAAHIVPLWNAAGYVLDLTTINDKTSIANVNADAQALPGASASGTNVGKFYLGQVVRGFRDNAFKLVLVSSGSATVAAGSTVIWGGASTATTAATAKVASTVTSDFSDVTAQQFAGVAIATITAGNYGWIQIAGTAYAAKVEANVAAGDTVSVSEATDETLTSATNEVQTLTLTSFDAGDTIKLTHAAVESATAVTASASAGVTLAAFQAVADALFLVTIPGYVAGACVVTQTTLNVTYVFTFSGASVRFTDQSAITATSGTGGSSGSFAETFKGNGAASGTVGTAQSAADTGTANIMLRSALARNLRSRQKDLFRDARN